MSSIATQQKTERAVPVSPNSVTSGVPAKYFFFFLISGFCGLLYEVIWLRLGMAEFGVTITMTSTVVSVFMAGLGLGSWLAGKLTIHLEACWRFRRLHAYGLVELIIGIGSLVVPYELSLGRRLLESAGLSSSFGYYAIAGLWLALALLPWCVSMGATYPFAMWAIRGEQGDSERRSFSYLYVANVVGALCGAVLPLFLIELWGFRGTLRLGGGLNLLLAIAAFLLSKPRSVESANASNAPMAMLGVSAENTQLYFLALFATGLTSMGMEVVWIRLYTPFLGTEVYAFATILAIYLAATALGSMWYRIQKKKAGKFSVLLWTALGLLALLPLTTSHPSLAVQIRASAFLARNVARVLYGIAPFTIALGFLTPLLVDRISGGDPDKAGRAYAVNVAGCILGPLLSGFLFLPTIGERWSLTIFAIICWLAGASIAFSKSEKSGFRFPVRQGVVAASVAVAVLLLLKTRSFESQFQQKVVLRDNTATVVATGTGMQKRLLVNGIGMSSLTPITKVMAHFPLAELQQPPQRALVICFGMGTTYRSLLTWGIYADAAELVPSVPKMFPYFHDDAPQVLASPLGHIVVDDGRRYLERTTETYDLITIDPPPPVEAAGSSLLYTREFYQAAKKKLRPGGILMQWLPKGDATVQSSVTKAITQEFPHVRAFGSIQGWGVHLMASDVPLPSRSAGELAHKLPPGAASDLVEWGPYSTAEAQFAAVLSRELAPETLILKNPIAPAMVDDRPVNEYFFLRSLGR